MTEKLETNPTKCTKLRQDRRDDTSFEELANEYDFETMYEVLLHTRGFCNCFCECSGPDHPDGCTVHTAETRPVSDGKPWHDRDLMMELYAEHLMSFKEMGERLGCHNETAQSWIADEDKHDIVFDLLGTREVKHSSSPTHRRCLLANTDWKEHIDKKQAKLRETPA